MKKWDQRFLDLAKHVSSWSKDPSTKVGAVITDRDNRIVSIGYNGFPKGINDDLEKLNNREIKYKYIIHAERNSLLFANKPTEGCTLYTFPFMPCPVCAGMIIQAGIKRVVSYSTDNPRWFSDFVLSAEMFCEAKVKLDLYVNKGG